MFDAPKESDLPPQFLSTFNNSDPNIILELKTFKETPSDCEILQWRQQACKQLTKTQCKSYERDEQNEIDELKKEAR